MGKMHQEGVTLIELLVTLAVAAIIVAVGVPAMRDFFLTNRMSAAANDLVSSLHFARSEAIKRGAAIRMCPSNDWDTPTPTCTAGGSLADGWIIFAATGDESVVLQRHEPLPDTLRLKDDIVETVDFDPSGTLSPDPERELNLLLCDDRGDRDMGGGLAAGRWINVRGAGRPRIYDRKTEVQNILGGCDTGA
jgi:type IV fimbrial biogenesis protein FimT